MNKIYLMLLTMLFLLGTGSITQAAVVDDLLDEYRSQGAGEFKAGTASTMWTQKYKDAKSGKNRACTSCHSKDLKASGKHVKTGKKIDPMAPSVNAERLTDVKKIRKWFRRNCKWTLGRECTAQEKGDFLTYIREL